MAHPDVKQKYILIVLSGCVGFKMSPEINNQADWSDGFPGACLPQTTTVMAKEMITTITLSKDSLHRSNCEG